jgi:hypothetical protein
MEVQVPRTEPVTALGRDDLCWRQAPVVEREAAQGPGLLAPIAASVVATRRDDHALIAREHAHLVGVDADVEVGALRHLGADHRVRVERVHLNSGRVVEKRQDVPGSAVERDVDRPRTQRDRFAALDHGTVRGDVHHR